MRNYQNESKWQKNKYDTIRASLDKELGKKLRIKLKKENLTITGWVRDNAIKYLNL